MSPVKKNARVAGILYILLMVVAPVRLMYIQNAMNLHVPADNRKHRETEIRDGSGIVKLKEWISLRPMRSG